MLKFLVLFIAAFSVTAHSKVTLEKYKKSNEVAIRITEKISTIDLDDFRNALQKVEREKLKLHLNTIQLNSEGGSGNTAIAIGRLIRKNNLNTYIAPKDYCASACVPIFLGGVQRYGFGVIGVHDSTFNEEAAFAYKDLPSLIDKSDLRHINYLKEMDISQSLADLIHSTKFWDVRYLTDDEKILFRVNGTDRATSEILVAEMARERNISKAEFKKILSSQYNGCFDEMRYLKQTAWECLKMKDYKVDWWELIKYSMQYSFQVIKETLYNYQWK